MCVCVSECVQYIISERKRKIDRGRQTERARERERKRNTGKEKGEFVCVGDTNVFF